MTMILTCLTKDFIIQSSDRRISQVKNNEVRWYDDQSNKALVYKSQFVFAYTGQATIPVKENGLTIFLHRYLRLSGEGKHKLRLVNQRLVALIIVPSHLIIFYHRNSPVA